MHNSVLKTPHDKQLPSRHVCPHIGMKDDAETYFAYPTLGNHCYQANPDQPIRVAYQSKFCLSANHQNCPVFSTSCKGALPDDIAAVVDITPLSNRKRLPLLIFLLVIFLSGTLLLFVLGSLFSSESKIKTSISYDSTETLSSINKLKKTETHDELFKVTNLSTATLIEIVNTPSVIPTDNITLVDSILTTPTPNFTSTPIKESPTPGPALETPFGPDLMFLLHVVKEAESLGKIAQFYNTSPDVIRAANNFIEGANLWVDTVLVILPGQLINEGIPKFKVILVNTQTNVTELSQEYGIDKDSLIFYNSLGLDEVIPAGRWLIIPIR